MGSSRGSPILMRSNNSEEHRSTERERQARRRWGMDADEAE